MSNRAFAISVSIAVSVASIAGLAQVREIGGVGLTVFTDPSFRGHIATLREDVANFQAVGLNDRVSSLRVGRGERWEVCEHANYQGRCVVVSGSESNLRETGWNDIISSARRIDAWSGGAAAPPSAFIGLELFSGQGFAGERRRFNGGQPDLRTVSFNDVARSLRVNPREVWEICEDINYVGCQIVNSDVRDLRRFNLSKRISSVRPVRGGRSNRDISR